LTPAPAQSSTLRGLIDSEPRRFLVEHPRSVSQAKHAMLILPATLDDAVDRLAGAVDGFATTLEDVAA
jgi:hypothetical protein